MHCNRSFWCTDISPSIRKKTLFEHVTIQYVTKLTASSAVQAGYYYFSFLNNFPGLLCQITEHQELCSGHNYTLTFDSTCLTVQWRLLTAYSFTHKKRLPCNVHKKDYYIICMDYHEKPYVGEVAIFFICMYVLQVFPYGRNSIVFTQCSMSWSYGLNK